jgi:hypothetical protein
VPLVAHFPFIAAMSRMPGFGVHTRVLTKLQRLAGFDVIIMPGFGERMMTSEAEVLENVAACTEPMGPIKPEPAGARRQRLGGNAGGRVPPASATATSASSPVAACSATRRGPAAAPPACARPGVRSRCR